MKNLYDITDKIKKRYVPLIEEYIKNITIDDNVEPYDLTGTDINFYRLDVILRQFGYKEVEFLCNDIGNVWKYYRHEQYHSIAIFSNFETFQIWLEPVRLGAE